LAFDAHFYPLCKHKNAPQGGQHLVGHCLAHHCQHLVVLFKAFVSLDLADVSKRHHPALFVVKNQLLNAHQYVDLELVLTHRKLSQFIIKFFFGFSK
jgi:hypothetical protein